MRPVPALFLVVALSPPPAPDTGSDLGARLDRAMQAEAAAGFSGSVLVARDGRISRHRRAVVIVLTAAPVRAILRSMDVVRGKRLERSDQ
jgi:hypothetical protein